MRRGIRQAIAGLAVAAALAAPSWTAFAAGFQTSVATIGYGDQTARGLTATVALFIPLTRGDTATGSSHLDLELSHSPLLLPDRSTVTVSVNGTAVTSARLDETNRSHGRLLAALPVLDAPAGGYFVEVQFGMRLTRDDCEDPNNPALWSTVHAGSQVVLEAAAIPGSRRVGAISALLTPPAYGPSRGITQFVLPAAPSADQLEAAGRVAWQLGRWSAALHRDPLISLARGSATGSPSVVIGTGSGVSVEQADAVRVAVGSLADARELSSPGRVPAPGPLPWSAGAASFAQLGFESQQATGPGFHQLTAIFDRPPVWDLDQGGGLDLVLEVSSDIRTDTSHVRVRVDGVEIGDQRLQAGRHHYRFELPAGELSTTLQGNPVRALALVADVSLDLPQQRCVPLPPGAGSVSMLPESSWYLPHHLSSSADIGRFPAGLGGRVDVVIPASGGDSELAAALQLCAALGRFQDPGADPPRLLKASSLSAGDRAHEALILVGAADAELGHEVAGHPPTAGGAELILVHSPFGGANEALAVHGSGSGLIAGAQALAREAVLAQVRGHEVAIGGGGTIDPQIGAVPGESAPAELTPRLEESFWERFPIRQTVALVLLVAVLLAAALLAYRRYGPSRS